MLNVTNLKFWSVHSGVSNENRKQKVTSPEQKIETTERVTSPPFPRKLHKQLGPNSSKREYQSLKWLGKDQGMDANEHR